MIHKLLPSALPASFVAPSVSVAGAKAVAARAARTTGAWLPKAGLKTRICTLLAAAVVTLFVLDQVATYAYPPAAAVQVAQAPR